MGRRASSRTLPIIVGVGMAVGVFGGLMIIRGTGSPPAIAGTDSEVPEGGDGNDEKTPVLLGAPDARPPEVVATVEVDAAPAQVTPPRPEKRTVTLRFEVSPRGADIEVDGKPVKNGALALDLAAGERKQVEVVVEADGYEPWTKKLAISTTDDEQAVSVELEKIKRTTPPVRRPPRQRDDPGRRRDRDRRPGGGIIDL
jgi:PEGA domain